MFLEEDGETAMVGVVYLNVKAILDLKHVS